MTVTYIMTNIYDKIESTKSLRSSLRQTELLHQVIPLLTQGRKVYSMIPSSDEEKIPPQRQVRFRQTEQLPQSSLDPVTCSGVPSHFRRATHPAPGERVTGPLGIERQMRALRPLSLTIDRLHFRTTTHARYSRKGVSHDEPFYRFRAVWSKGVLSHPWVIFMAYDLQMSRGGRAPVKLEWSKGL